MKSLYEELNIDPMGQVLLEKLVCEKVSMAMKQSVKMLLERFDANYHQKMQQVAQNEIDKRV